MSKGILLCVVVLLQAAYLCLLAGNQMIAGQIGDEFLCQDPTRRPSLMLSHVPDEFDITNAARSFPKELHDEEVLGCNEYAGDHGGVPDKVVAGGSDPDVDVEEELLLGGHDDDGEAKVQCPECGKRFKNDKSMFGHLRSHPNRGYKGATPPLKKPKSMPNSNDASPASLSPVDDRPMARYRDNQATQQAPLPSPSCSKRKHESSEQAGAGKEESAMSKAGAEGDNPVLRDEHGSSVVEVRRKRSKEGREAHRKEKDAPSTKEKRPYICKHCKAEFPTRQALGGHMAAHNKDKRNQAPNEKEAGEAYQGKIDQSQNEQEAEIGEERRSDRPSLSSTGPHAEHLSKVFDKGWHSRQDPGGYMRQQSERKDDDSPPAVDGQRRRLLDIDLGSPPAADGQRRRLLDIDLNVEAPEQE